MGHFPTGLSSSSDHLRHTPSKLGQASTREPRADLLGLPVWGNSFVLSCSSTIHEERSQYASTFVQCLTSVDNALAYVARSTLSVPFNMLLKEHKD